MGRPNAACMSRISAALNIWAPKPGVRQAGSRRWWWHLLCSIAIQIVARLIHEGVCRVTDPKHHPVKWRWRGTRLTALALHIAAIAVGRPPRAGAVQC